MSGLHDSDDTYSLSIRVAELYYLDQRNKSEIATELGISRFKVARILDHAVDSGIVRITFHRPDPPPHPLALELKAKYGLEHVSVVPAEQHSPTELREELGAAAATFLERYLRPNDVLGVGWGRTTKAIVDIEPQLPLVPVVQLAGIAGSPGENSMELVRLFAKLTGGAAYPLYCPLVAPDADSAKALHNSGPTGATFEQFARVSFAILPIGSWNPPNSQLRSFLSRENQEALARDGVVAELGGILIDEHGLEVTNEVSERILGIRYSELTKIRRVVAVAGHSSKVNAILAVLRSQLISGLITDSVVARALLSGPA